MRSVLTFFLLLCAGAPFAQQVLLTPPSPAAESFFLVDAGGLSPGQVYSVELNTGGGAMVLGDATADRTGSFLLEATVPDVAPGSYMLDILAARNLVVSQPIAVRSQPAISLNQASGSPGDRVQFTATGLLPGTLELRLGTHRLFGPVPAGETVSGDFLVPAPRDRDPPIVLLNRVGRLLVGSASTPFQIEEDNNARYEPRAESVNLPSETVRPDQTSTVTGRLILPSQVLNDPEAKYSLVMKYCGDGSVFPAPVGLRPGQQADDCVMVPVDSGSVVVDPNGDFSAEISTASLLYGGTVPPSADPGVTDLGLAYATPERRGVFLLGTADGSYVAPASDLPEIVSFDIKLTDLFDIPLEGALVGLEEAPLVDPECGLPVCEDQPDSAGGAVFSTDNQFSWIQDLDFEIELGPLNTCPTGLNRGFTDENGVFTITINRAALTLALKTSGLLAGLDINTNVPRFPRYYPMRIKMNALFLEGTDPPQSYGVVVDGSPTGLFYDLFYDAAWGRFYEGAPSLELLEASGNNANPPAFGYPEVLPGELKFALAPVSITDDEIQFPEDPQMPGLIKYTLPDERKTPIFKTLTRVGEPVGVDLDIIRPARIEQYYDAFLFGQLESLNLALTGPGYRVDRQLQLTSPDPGCSPDGISYGLDLPDGHMLAAGTYEGKLTGQVGNGGPTFAKIFQFEVVEGPKWLNDETLGSRRIEWSPEEVTLSAMEPPAMTSISETPDPNYDVGTLDNDTQNDAWRYETLTPGNFSEIVRIPQSANLALSAETEEVPQSPLNINGDTAKDGNVLNDFEVKKQEILDSGKIPLFRYGWDLWPIAEATVGADFWFKVFFESFGEIVKQADRLITRMVASPSVTAALDIFIDASILFDIVDIDVDAIPQITVALVACQNGGTATSSELFNFILKARYEISVGICPLCLSSSGVRNLINESTTSGNSQCRIEPEPNIPDAAKGETTRTTPQGRSALATNGRGRSARVWTDASGAIQMEVANAGLVETAAEINAQLARGVTDLTVEWISRSRAVMVWAQSALDSQSFDTLRVELEAANRTNNGAMPDDWEPVVSQQHLRYAVYENGTWTEPMTLTPPGFGEGGVQLASCPGEETRSSACPAAGEVMAVFTRDIASDAKLSGDQRVFYTRFDGAAWTPPARLDPTSLAKEVQPAVTYVQGQPVAVWVRNPTRSLADLNQRELAYRFINSESQGTVPTGISNGLASPSLRGDSLGRLVVAYSVAQDPGAFLGNRRSLHLAVGDCSSFPCVWAETELLDAFDRRIWAERPQLEITPADLAVVGFRHLGYGSLTNEPLVRAEDSLGATLGTGDMAMVSVDLETGAALLDPLTDDSGVHGMPDLAFDPFLGEFIASSTPVADIQAKVLAQTRSLKRQPVPTRGIAQRLGNGTGPSLVRIAALPDLAVRELTVTAAPESLLNNVEMVLTVANRGAPFEGTVGLVFAWDGPGDAGLPVWYGDFSDPGPGGTTITAYAGFPEGASVDDTRRLFVQLDNRAELNDANGANNVASAVVGALPVSVITSAMTSPTADGVLLDWDDADDPRVVGYRIYRGEDGADLVPVGSSFTSGYYDFSVDSSRSLRYRVTAFSHGGVESPPGPILELTPQPRRSRHGGVLFADGFEPIQR